MHRRILFQLYLSTQILYRWSRTPGIESMSDDRLIEHMTISEKRK